MGWVETKDGSEVRRGDGGHVEQIGVASGHTRSLANHKRTSSPSVDPGIASSSAAGMESRNLAKDAVWSAALTADCKMGWPFRHASRSPSPGERERKSYFKVMPVVLPRRRSAVWTFGEDSEGADPRNSPVREF